MNRISECLGTAISEQMLEGVVAQPFRVGSENLVAWKQWKEQVWKPCPFGVADQTKCSVHLCPCALLQVNRWVNGISGYLGTVKLVKYLHARNGNTGGDRQGRVPRNESPQKQADAQDRTHETILLPASIPQTTDTIALKATRS